MAVKAEKAAKAAGIVCDCVHLTNDFPADAILSLAKKRKCDLIFMASHGRRGLRGVLLGSETQKVLAGAKLPVLVYR
jgi:nucleotide-binding universal stress UspA family protein